MGRIPDRLHIDVNDRKLYEKIEEQEMFRGRTRKEQFLFAMALGVRNEVAVPFKTKEGFFLTKDLRPEDEALINAVILWSKDSVDILSDKEKVYKIAEEYAHAGIRLLVDKIESVEFGSFWKQFEKDLYEMHEKFSSEINTNDKKSFINRT